MPKDFQFPPGEPDPPELWSPLQLNPASTNRGSHNYYLLGRLKPGVSLDEARREMARLVEEADKAATPNYHTFQPERHLIVMYADLRSFASICGRVLSFYRLRQVSEWIDVATSVPKLEKNQPQMNAYARAWWGDSTLSQAINNGLVPQSRLDKMAHRILRAMFEVGLFDYPPAVTPIDADTDAAIAQEAEEQGAVLLKNDRAQLPLDPNQINSIALSYHIVPASPRRSVMSRPHLHHT